MQNPLWVADARVGVLRPFAWGNHMCDVSVKEGRTRPVHAWLRAPRNILPLTRPETVKSASSQGEALALVGRYQTQNQTQLKDMKMEFNS